MIDHVTTYKRYTEMLFKGEFTPKEYMNRLITLERNKKLARALAVLDGVASSEHKALDGVKQPQV